MSDFTEWTLAKLERRFGLQQVRMLPDLAEWMKADVEISPFEQANLDFHQNSLAVDIFGWNEQELSLNFIGPLLSLVNFSTGKTNLFAGRDIEGIVDGEHLRGKPDGMLASGTKEPVSPYFCIQEYTSTPLSTSNDGTDGDPFGQCLSAMLVAQEINDHHHPIFGVVVVGQQWNFMVLKGNEYTISHGFIALDDDLFQIFRMLKSLKATVQGFVVG